MNFQDSRSWKYRKRYFTPLRFKLRDNKVRAKYARKRELAFVKHNRTFKAYQRILIRGQDY